MDRKKAVDNAKKAMDAAEKWMDVPQVSYCKCSLHVITPVCLTLLSCTRVFIVNFWIVIVSYRLPNRRKH